jgi:hypothetical protein
LGARLFGGGTRGHFKADRSELAEKIVLVDQVCMHHDARSYYWG